MDFTRVASFWSGGTPRKLQQHSATPTRGSMMRFGWLPTYGCHVVLIYGIFAHFFVVPYLTAAASQQLPEQHNRKKSPT